MNQPNNGFQQNAHPSSTSNPNDSTVPTSGGFGQAFDPFSDNAPNPFAPQPAQHQQQAPQNMPNGMMQQPPQQQEQGAHSPAPNGQQGASPLDRFVPKPDNNSQGSGQQQPAAPAQEEPQKTIFDNGLDAYQKMVASNNFVGTIAPEDMQKIMSGDVEALSNVINNAVRQGVATASYTSARVAHSGLNRQFQDFQDKTLPGLLTDHSFQQGWANNNDAILSHPAVAPLVQQQTNTFRQQYPEASVQEIQQKVTEYFKEVAGAFTTQGQQTAQEEQQQANQATELEQFFNM